MKYMKHFFCVVLMLVAFVSDSAMANVAQTDDGEWQLVFSDEFNQKDGSQPDPTKWNRSQRGSSMWSRWISPTSKDVVYIKGGKLICRAIPNRHEPADTAQMLTGAVDTKGKFSFQYGKVEVCMRTNLRRGNFPAAWMVRVPGDKDPRYAEIDIVEVFGNDSRSAHTVHTERSYTLKKEGLQRDRKVDVNVKKWHVYGIEWDKDKIVWTLDGREVFRYNRLSDTKMEQEGQWTFDRPLCLILNQSVGNGSHPLLVPNLKKTYETQFDWIRVYQKK